MSVGGILTQCDHWEVGILTANCSQLCVTLNQPESEQQPRDASPLLLCSYIKSVNSDNTNCGDFGEYFYTRIQLANQIQIQCRPTTMACSHVLGSLSLKYYQFRNITTG